MSAQCQTPGPSLSLNADGVSDASEPRGDRHAGHRHLAAGLAGQPFRNLPTVAAALSISQPLLGTFCPEQGALGCREGAAVLLGSCYRTSCPYLPSVQPPEPPPSSYSDLPEEAEQLQPQGLYTCSSASEPGLFLRQSCVAQAGLELLADVMKAYPVYVFLG